MCEFARVTEGGSKQKCRTELSIIQEINYQGAVLQVIDWPVCNPRRLSMFVLTATSTNESGENTRQRRLHQHEFIGFDCRPQKT